MQLTDLPYDLLVQVIELLVKDGGRTVTRTLARTSATCRELHDLVESIGWRAYYLDQMGALALNNNFEPLTLDPTDPGCPGTWRDLARDHGKFAQTWLAHPWSPGYDTYVYHSFGCHQPGGPDLPSEIFSSKESYGGDQRYFAVMTSHEQHGEIVYGIHMLDLECMVWTGLVRLKESELPDPEQFHGARSLFLSYVWDDGSAVLVCSVIDELHVWIMKVSMETGLTDTFRGFPNSTAHPVASDFTVNEIPGKPHLLQLTCPSTPTEIAIVHLRKDDLQPVFKVLVPCKDATAVWIEPTHPRAIATPGEVYASVRIFDAVTGQDLTTVTTLADPTAKTTIQVLGYPTIYRPGLHDSTSTPRATEPAADSTTKAEMAKAVELLKDMALTDKRVPEAAPPASSLPMYMRPEWMQLLVCVTTTSVVYEGEEDEGVATVVAVLPPDSPTPGRTSHPNDTAWTTVLRVEDDSDDDSDDDSSDDDVEPTNNANGNNGNNNNLTAAEGGPADDEDEWEDANSDDDADSDDDGPRDRVVAKPPTRGYRSASRATIPTYDATLLWAAYNYVISGMTVVTVQNMVRPDPNPLVLVQMCKHTLAAWKRQSDVVLLGHAATTGEQVYTASQPPQWAKVYCSRTAKQPINVCHVGCLSTLDSSDTSLMWVSNKYDTIMISEGDTMVVLRRKRELGPI